MESLCVRDQSSVPFGAAFQTIVGGNITILTRLCEQTRSESFDIMVLHGSELGANAIIGARYDATEIMTGVTEVLAYGTAVIVEPIEETEGIESGG